MTCGDVEENPGPSPRLMYDDDESEDEALTAEVPKEPRAEDDAKEREERREDKQMHPVLKQLIVQEKAGRRIDVPLIVDIIVRYFEGEEEEARRVSRPTSLELEQADLKKALKRTQTDEEKLKEMVGRKRKVDAELRKLRLRHDVKANTVRTTAGF